MTAWLIIPGCLTAIGGLLIFLWRMPTKLQLHLGLALTAGIMVAASFFSLLLPSIDRGPIGMVLLGFVLGGLALLGLDQLIPHHGASEEKRLERRSKKVLLALTIHNIPEGMAVGVAWGAGGPELGLPLAIGIGLQNIPEGFAAATVMRSGGASPKRSALVGAATGLVEPPAAVAAFLLVQSASFLLTPALAFAAAAMIYVVADELIPESQHPGHESKISLAFLTGFLIMMTLDLLLA